MPGFGRVSARSRHKKQEELCSVHSRVGPAGPVGRLGQDCGVLRSHRSYTFHNTGIHSDALSPGRVADGTHAGFLSEHFHPKKPEYSASACSSGLMCLPHARANTIPSEHLVVRAAPALKDRTDCAVAVALGRLCCRVAAARITAIPAWEILTVFGTTSRRSRGTGLMLNIPAEMPHLNPLTNSDYYASTLLGLIFDTLLDRDPETMESIPNAATSAKFQTTTLVYTFHLCAKFFRRFP